MESIGGRKNEKERSFYIQQARLRQMSLTKNVNISSDKMIDCILSNTIKHNETNFANGGSVFTTNTLSSNYDANVVNKTALPSATPTYQTPPNPILIHQHHIPEIYTNVWAFVRIENTQLCDTNRLYPILLSSGLNTDLLAKIWAQVNQTILGRLTMNELFVALALIALNQQCQAEVNTPASIVSLQALPIPKLNFISLGMPFAAINGLANQNSTCSNGKTESGADSTSKAPQEEFSEKLLKESVLLGNNLSRNLNSSNILDFGDDSPVDASAQTPKDIAILPENVVEFADFQSARNSDAAFMNRMPFASLDKSSDQNHELFQSNRPSTSNIYDVFRELNTKTETDESDMNILDRASQLEDKFSNLQISENPSSENTSLPRTDCSPQSSISKSDSDHSWSRKKMVGNDDSFDDFKSMAFSNWVSSSNPMNAGNAQALSSISNSTRASEEWPNERLETKNVGVTNLSSVARNSRDSPSKTSNVNDNLEFANFPLSIPKPCDKNFNYDDNDDFSDFQSSSSIDQPNTSSLLTDNKVKITTPVPQHKPMLCDNFSEDRYKAFKEIEQDNQSTDRKRSEQDFYNVNLVLQHCKRLMHRSFNILLVNHCEPPVLEALSTERGRNFALDLSQIFKIVKRISKYFSTLENNCPGQEIQALLEDIIIIWKSIEKLLIKSGIQLKSQKSSSEPFNLVTEESKESRSECAICRSRCKSNAFKGEKAAYHLTCANFWINCINSDLPGYS